MSAIRRLHWFWLAGGFLVAGLTVMWTPSLKMADDGVHVERIVRSRGDLNVQPQHVETVILPVTTEVRPAPLRIPAAVEFPQSDFQVEHSDLDIPAAPPLLPLAPAQFESGRKLGVPDSVWLSGSIEPLKSAE